MGSEPTPGAFIDALLTVIEECRRVLAPHGSIAIELGDTFAGSGGAGGDYNEGGLREDAPKFSGSASRSGWHRLGVRAEQTDQPPNYRKTGTVSESGSSHGGDGWPLAKSLCMIPELFRFALAYGFNPLTGRETPRWRVRNVVRHFRPNPPVGALGDKVRPATSEWVVACVGTKRYFDLDSVRTPLTEPDHDQRISKGTTRADGWGRPTDHVIQNPAGAPPLDWWDDDDLEWRDGAGFVEPTAPYPGAHYATFSPKVVARLIQPMCPARVCRECGKPSERIAETSQQETGRSTNGRKPRDRAESFGGTTYEKRTEAVVTTLGWTNCGHDSWRPGVVLDPFCGTFTTGMVVVGHGRSAIGIDLNEANADLARERCGMFLEVERTESLDPSHLT